MGEVIQAAKIFQRNAKGNLDKEVHLVMNTFDHVFLKIARKGILRAIEIIAVPLDQYPDIQFKKGDVIRFKLSSKIISPSDGEKPCAVISKIEILKGKIEILPVVQVEYTSGHRYAAPNPRL